MKNICLYTLIIIALGIVVSCSSFKSQNQNAQMQLFEDGKLVASIFKYNGKEYHIWTKKEVKNSRDAIIIRNELKIGKEYTAYFYNDSTSDEGHYYAYYQTLYHRNLSAKEDAFIDGTDTIQLITHSNNSFDILTSRELNYEHVSLFKRALNYMNIGSDNTCFLYLKGSTGEDYYATYNGVNIHKKITQEQKIENMISALKEGINIDSKIAIISFFDKIEKGKNLLYNCNNKDQQQKLRLTLISFQKKHFPKARKIYYQNAKNELWEKDIEVELSGKNITFTGYMFVKNQVKKDTFLEIQEEVSKLRFKTVGFRAFDGDDRTYWELTSKSDTEI